MPRPRYNGNTSSTLTPRIAIALGAVGAFRAEASSVTFSNFVAACWNTWNLEILDLGATFVVRFLFFFSLLRFNGVTIGSNKLDRFLYPVWIILYEIKRTNTRSRGPRRPRGPKGQREQRG